MSANKADKRRHISAQALLDVRRMQGGGIKMKSHRQKVTEVISSMEGVFSIDDMLALMPEISKAYMQQMLWLGVFSGFLIKYGKKKQKTVLYRRSDDFEARIVAFENVPFRALRMHKVNQNAWKAIPRCTDAKTYAQWRSTPCARTLVTGFCTDCLPEYRDRMAAQGLCDHPETLFYIDSDGFVFGSWDNKKEEKGE